ncbi:MAG: DNA translocase FtsK [Spirosomataceae bacterium]
MAKNTYKDPPPTLAPDKKSRKQTEGKQLRIQWGERLASREFQLALGGFLIIMSLFLLIALGSYLFTGVADQSVVKSAFSTKYHFIRPVDGQAPRNFFGLFGAMLSHLLIFRMFGIVAFLFVPLIFLAGTQVILRRELIPLARFTWQSLFYLFWGSSLMGLIVFASHSEKSLSWLCGGIGYEINVFLYNLIGWASILVIVFVLFLFVIYFYGVTSVEQLASRFDQVRSTWSESDHYPVENANPTPKPKSTIRQPSSPNSEEALDKEPDYDDEAVMKANVNRIAEEAAKELTLSPTPKTTKLNGSKEPTFIVEQTPEEKLEKPISFEAENSVNEQVIKEFGLYDPTLDLPRYQFPVLDLLRDYVSDKQQVTQEELEANKDKIVTTLGEFGIVIASIKATVGPTVTLYEIIPDAGVRISKIKNLEDDIALKLAALGIRIIAPIPGKGTIGIEVPNKNRETVSIKSLIGSERFQKSTHDLPIVLGKTISNEIFLTDLAKMPHLLMAGATGQGKSVGLNVILTSLLYKKHPAQLKFVLVDPKKVELTLFNKIERHFLAKLPNSAEAIITDTKKVVHTLNSLCIEMEMRYDLLKEAGCRNIKEYNAKFVQRQLNPEKGHRFMPYIVLVVDELADLMMTAGKEVEQPIARLAQLARAIGIHLVVATQRPSVNVITGIIKANFPARLSFKVTAKVDSRTILDTGGAEQLVGMGDMLLSQGSDIIRLQCAFVDTPEVDSVCDFIGEQQGYASAYQLPEFEGDESGDEKEDFDVNNLDPMFEEAARLIVLHQQGSTSLIQRKLKLGYNRAGRLIDQLEAFGIVGAFEGSKAREVLVKSEEELNELLKNLK